jgi:hypothetical protein
MERSLLLVLHREPSIFDIISINRKDHLQPLLSERARQTDESERALDVFVHKK